MGIRSSHSPKNREYQTLLSQFSLLQQNEPLNLKYLEHKLSKQEYLLREMTFFDEQTFKKRYTSFMRMKQVLEGSEHVLGIKRIMVDREEGMVVNVYRLVLLVEFPQRTLDDEINQRGLQRRMFKEEQLWSILASCILGLNHLQKHKIPHRCLKSRSILIAQDGIIKLYNPEIIGAKSNYDTILQERTTPHIYLSPQEMQDLKNQITRSKTKQAHKNDIWTLGMIIVEAGILMYQDGCYVNNYEKMNLLALNRNLNRFREVYSVGLYNLLMLMLDRDGRTRPSFQELEAHIIKIEENHETFHNDNNLAQEKGEEKMMGTYGEQHYPGVYQQGLESHSRRESMSIEANMPKSPELLTIQAQLSKRRQERTNSEEFSQSFFSKNEVFRSEISKTRPMKSIFPGNNYKCMTIIDENGKFQQKNKKKSSEILRQLLPLDISNTQEDLDTPPQSFTQPFFQDKTDQLNEYFHKQPIYNSHQLNNNENLDSSSSKRLNINHPPPHPPLNMDRYIESASSSRFVVESYHQGSRYQGTMMKGLKHGYGKFYYQDGGHYDGSWHLGKMNGRGKLYYPSGKLAYDGDWKDDKFHGQGHLYNETPQILHSSFDFRNFDHISQFWTKYQGQFMEDDKHGKGTIYLSNGQFYSGGFWKDLIDGLGIFQVLDGRRINSTWSRNHIL